VEKKTPNGIISRIRTSNKKKYGYARSKRTFYLEPCRFLLLVAFPAIDGPITGGLERDLGLLFAFCTYRIEHFSRSAVIAPSTPVVIHI